MSGSVTKLAKLGLGTADPVDTAMNFADFDPGVLRALKDTNGTRGTFFRDGNRMLENRVSVSPKFSSEPTAPELAYWLEWAMSGTPTGTTTKTYVWSNTPAVRFVHFKPNAGEEWFLDGVAVDTFTIQATSGEALSINADLVGQGYDDTRSDFPAGLTYDQVKQPFLLSHLSLTVNSVARKCRSLSLTIRNAIDRDRYLNQLTLSALQKLDAAFEVSVDVPSGDNSGLWKLGIDTACPLVATFTNPSNSAAFAITIADLRFPANTPVHPSGAEGFLTVQAQAMRVGSNTPVTLTLNQGS